MSKAVGGYNVFKFLDCGTDEADEGQSVVARLASLEIVDAEGAIIAEQSGTDPGHAAGDDLAQADSQAASLSGAMEESWTSLLDAVREGVPELAIPREPAGVLSSLDLAGVVSHIQSGGARNVICMCGAGISVSAGIPDFRSKGTGLYDNLARYNLPYPEAVFELTFFRENPQPFYSLAKELAPTKYQPTLTHYFIRLLHDKGLLRRCYTQNIDSLESKAGVPADKVVAAHGNFDGAHCIECGRSYPMDQLSEAIERAEVCRCEKRSLMSSKPCGGLVKPRIVFFGESLPDRFWSLREQDFAECDLLIIMGTSLVVHPFAGLLNLVGGDCPRLLINREVVGDIHEDLWAMGHRRGLWFGEGNRRDVKHLGDCDDSVRHLASLLGWDADLDALMRSDEAAARATPSDPDCLQAAAEG